ncbi:MAG: hypothetical protein HYZ65_07900 [Burkholderiales bacterium]|nr:hypothetical protein [Burkholderiales bacterium]MBI3284757.1 hypothetical protein [Burkholderiales bacterium]
MELGARSKVARIRDDRDKMIAGPSISAPADRLQEEWLGDLIATAAEISTT